MPIGAARTGTWSIHNTFEQGYGLVVETTAVRDITAGGAELWGELHSLGPFDQADVYFEHAHVDTPVNEGNQSSPFTTSEPTTFRTVLDELNPETDYHFRAIAEASDLTLEVTTLSPQHVDTTSAELRGSLDTFGTFVQVRTGETMEFTTHPALAVETYPAQNVNTGGGDLQGELTHYYPDQIQ